MPKNTYSPALTKHHKIALAGIATLGAASIAFSAVPSSADTVVTGSPAAATQAVYGTQQIKDVKGAVTDQSALQAVKLDAIAARKAAAAHALHVAHVQQAAAQAKTQAAARQAAQARTTAQAASRAAARPQVEQAAAKTYSNNLDGWIRQALDIMRAKGIPGSYSGLHRNIMRESSGNPMAINNWDINAINGIPSKGLLQVIPPTFSTYHVAGTSWDIYNPVANITAAANYAAHRYGSIDNVNSAY
ncbi:transglycosylase SLT domain-containing protein [Streptomyces sp. NPDC007162]|uniref:transglycosylase SLT domain-containing protein n=1 Tax=Streptomyces sp. NPDC007162 TaxID=3156917 RepID=UPI00340195B1